MLPQWMVEAAASDSSKAREDKKCGERGKSKTTYVMSPRELESVARRVLDESDQKKNESS